MTKVPSHGETFTIGQSIKVKAFHTPCHTQDSVCFLFEDGDEKAVFTGDTLFIGGETDPARRSNHIAEHPDIGCGRFFEGTPEEMHKALNETLATLPDDTKVYVSALEAPHSTVFHLANMVTRSLGMSIPRRMSSLVSRSRSLSQSRS